MNFRRKFEFVTSTFLTILIVSGFAAAVLAQTSEKQVVSNITVMSSKGNYVSGLKPENFKVFEGKTEKTITSFLQDEPASIGVLLDASGSMSDLSGEKFKRLKSARYGLGIFVTNGNRANDYFVIGFNDKPQLLLETTQDPTAIQKMFDDTAKIKPLGTTSLYDALYIAIDKLDKAKHRKRVLLIITDGDEDNDSKYKYDNIREALKQSGVVTNAVCLQNSGQQRYQSYTSLASIDEFAAINGGRSYYPQSDLESNEVFQRLAIELQTQYSIAFEAAESAPADKSWHKLTVKVELPKDEARKFGKTFVRARSGYYSSAIKK